MTIKTDKYMRKPFVIDAVQVTEDNVHEVALWCGGSVMETIPEIAEKLGKPAQTFIKVPVSNAINERQTQARPTDWVMRANKGFKVYTNQAFNKCFESVYRPVTGNAISSGVSSRPVPAPPKNNKITKVITPDGAVVPYDEEKVEKDMDEMVKNQTPPPFEQVVVEEVGEVASAGYFDSTIELALDENLKNILTLRLAERTFRFEVADHSQGELQEIVNAIITRKDELSDGDKVQDVVVRVSKTK